MGNFSMFYLEPSLLYNQKVINSEWGNPKDRHSVISDCIGYTGQL